MTETQPNVPAAAVRHALDIVAASPLTWVVGDLKRWTSRTEVLPLVEGVIYMDVTELSVDSLIAHKPSVIISPLIMLDSDVIEVARLMQIAGYKGRYRILAESLPDHRIVLSEVKSVAPNVDVAIINLPGDKAATKT